MTAKINLAFLIDDNEIDQRHYKRVLERSGMVENVMLFSFADDALEHIKAHPDLEIDVIFLDINMPRMNGFEFIEAAIEQIGVSFAKVVVAMLTTSLNPEDRERANSFEVVKDFITKPLTVEHVKRVARLLDGGQQA